jgi:hypothetical protein
MTQLDSGAGVPKSFVHCLLLFASYLVTKMSGNSTLDLMVVGLKFLHINVFRLDKIAGIFWNGSYEKSKPVYATEKVA